MPPPTRWNGRACVLGVEAILPQALLEVQRIDAGEPGGTLRAVEHLADEAFGLTGHPRVDLVDGRELRQVVDHDFGAVTQLGDHRRVRLRRWIDHDQVGQREGCALLFPRQAGVAKLRPQRLQIDGGRLERAVEAKALVNGRLHPGIGTLRQHGKNGGEAGGRNDDVLALAARTLKLSDERGVQSRLRRQEAALVGGLGEGDVGSPVSKRAPDPVMKSRRRIEFLTEAMLPDHPRTIIAADEGARTARFGRICGRELNKNLESDVG